MESKKKTPLTESKRYRDFIQGRDHALESILHKYLSALDQIVMTLRVRSLEAAAHLSVKGISVYSSKRTREEFEKRISPIFDMAQTQVTHLMINLRASAFVLSNVGESEAIARALATDCRYKIGRNDIGVELNRETPSGGDLIARVELAIARLKSDVVEAFHHSQVLESPIEEMLERIKRVFPSSKQVKKPANTLKSLGLLMEARKQTNDGEGIDLGEIGPPLDTGFVDDEAWNQVVSDYEAENFPNGLFSRTPYDKVFYYNVNEDGDLEKETRYEWEVENEVTQDFVYAVRAGEVASAKENGISDLMWLAIIDSKTDECCSSRDGLSSAEIEEKLSQGDLGDECDAIVCPAHFKCRCRMVPMADNMPEETPPDFGSFDDWLKAG